MHSRAAVATFLLPMDREYFGNEPFVLNRTGRRLALVPSIESARRDTEVSTQAYDRMIRLLRVDELHRFFPSEKATAFFRMVLAVLRSSTSRRNRRSSRRSSEVSAAVRPRPSSIAACCSHFFSVGRATPSSFDPFSTLLSLVRQSLIASVFNLSSYIVNHLGL